MAALGKVPISGGRVLSRVTFVSRVALIIIFPYRIEQVVIHRVWIFFYTNITGELPSTIVLNCIIAWDKARVNSYLL
jgi:hypothetical protein